MTPNEAVEKLTDFVRGYKVDDLYWVLEALPATVDPALVATAFGRCADKPGFLASACRKLPARAIRAVVASLPSLPRHPDFVMWRVAVPAELADGPLVVAWKHALATTSHLSTNHGWASRKRRELIAALAADPVILPAIQAAVAHATLEVPPEMLAVLVADGSTASYDALVGHLGVAFAAADRRLDLLARLRVHAVRTPLLDALFAEIRGALAHRNDTSPALALGPLIGLGAPALLWFKATLVARRGTAAQVHVWIEVDSRAPIWFRTSALVGARDTRFSSDPADEVRDQIGVGTCTVTEIPRWIATVARHLGVTWNTVDARTHLRGAKKALLVRWLETG